MSTIFPIKRRLDEDCSECLVLGWLLGEGGMPFTTEGTTVSLKESDIATWTQSCSLSNFNHLGDTGSNTVNRSLLSE